MYLYFGIVLQCAYPQNILLRRLPADLTDTVSERPNSLWVVVNKDAYTGTCWPYWYALEHLDVQFGSLFATAKEWFGYDSNNGYAGTGRRVYENYGADTAQGYTYSSSAAPFYAWGALSGFIGLVHNGFYGALPDAASVLTSSDVREMNASEWGL